MPIAAPSPEQIRRIAERLGLDFTPGELQDLAGFLGEIKHSYDALDRLEERRPPVKYPRGPGHRPTPQENPYDAWYWKTEIAGAAHGPLEGKRIAVKDNICVAGVPMMNGSRLLEGYVPDVDATVITRVLDAGGKIVGKAACEDLCLSGASHTSKHGAVRNPHRPTHSSGGSSSGCAAVLASGDADMAIGGDQGGSIRIPSCWSGVYGLKPTYGLVPYTGIFPIELTVDHCGPMARNVADVAALLAVIAGRDGLDPRQVDVRVEDYLGAVRNADVTGLRIGLVKEGFGRAESEEVVDAKVRKAAKQFAGLGADLSEVSIPMHRIGYHIWSIILLEGSTELMFRCHGMGTNWKGYYATSLLDAFACGFRARPNDLPEAGKVNLLMAEYVRQDHSGRYYAKAQNLRPLLTEAYDAALRDFDVLLMPTVPFPATRIPPSDSSFHEIVSRGRDHIDANTGPLDASGHPALSLPCGIVDDLPIGMMLVGRHWEDATVLRAGQAFAAENDWTKL
jgi:amidase